MQVEMKELLEHYERSHYDRHYQFFWTRSLVGGHELATAQATFDEKFAWPLAKLVEAST